MGLRTPQQLDTTKQQAMPSVRVNAIKKEDLSANFLDTFAKTTDNYTNAQLVQDKKMTAIVGARARELMEKESVASQGEVAKVQGWNVLQTSKEQADGLQQKLMDIKGQFHEKYEPYLENIRLDVMNRFTQSTQPYVNNQLKKTTNDTYAALIANEMNATILNSGDLNTFSSNLERVKNIVREKAYVQRGEDENAEVAPGMTLKSLIDNETNAATSKTVANSVIQLADLGNLANAKALFEKHDADMNADDRLKAVEAMKRAMNSDDSKAATAAADIIQKKANDLVEAEKMASEMGGTDKMRGAIMSIIKNRHWVATEATKKKNADTQNEVWETLSQPGKTLKDVESSMRKLPVPMQNEIIDTINKNNGSVVPATTNFQKYDEALTAIHTDPSVVENKNFLSQYIPHLNPSDFSFIKGQYNSKKKSVADGQEWLRVNAGKLILDDVTRFNNERGIVDYGLISKNKRVAMEYADGLMKQNPKMDQLELQKKVKAFMYMNSGMPKIEEKGWFGKLWAHTLGDGQDFEVDYKNPQMPDALDKSGNAISYSEEDKNAFREAAKRQFIDAKKPVNNLAIEKALRARMLNGQSLKVE